MPAASQLALVACLVTTCGAGMSQSLWPIVGVPAVLAGFAAAWFAAARMHHAPSQRPFTWIYFWLSVNLACALSTNTTYKSPMWYAIAFRAHPTLGIFLVGVVAGGSARARRYAIWTAVLSATALLIATPIAMPRPLIDVWILTQTSVRALLAGVHPYTIIAPDIYGGGYDFGYTTTVYPYMPLDLIMNAPAVALLGDYRFGLALSFPVTVLIVRAAARRMRVPEHTIDVVTLALALQPYGALLVAAGYIEPLMIMVLAIFLYVSASDMGGTSSAVSLFMLPALKQYVATPVLLFLGMKPRLRSVVVGAAAAAATVVPFLVSHRHATWTGMTAILNNMRSPAAFRTDALSLTAWTALVFGVQVGPWLGALVQLAAGGAAFALLRRDGLAGFLLASAISLIASFLVGTQAFTNYYAFGAAALLFSSLALARQDGRT